MGKAVSSDDAYANERDVCSWKEPGSESERQPEPVRGERKGEDGRTSVKASEAAPVKESEVERAPESEAESESERAR